MTTQVNRRSAMVLFSNPRCAHSHRARIVLMEKDIAVDLVNVDPSEPPDDLLHLNPYNSLPTLVDRDLVLYDSRVIVEYLDERFPHPPLMPVDPVSRARTRIALYRIENDWYPLLMELMGPETKQTDSLRKQLRESLLSTVDVFAVKPFFLSDEFSLVDVSLAALLWRLPYCQVDLGKQGKVIDDYARRLFARPAFRDSLSDVEREMR